MNPRKLFLLVIVLMEWFALIAQLVLHLQAVPAGSTESLIRFLSYFTILTNIIVAVYVTIQWGAHYNKRTGFFFNPSVESAITLYITVVGLIYNLVLRQLWHSEGLQAVLHDILHTIVPLLMLIYWFKWVNARNVSFKNIPAWLLYPASYAVGVLIRGHFAGWYPYPFLDAITLGYRQIMINSVLLILVFLVFSYMLVFIGRRKSGGHY